MMPPETATLDHWRERCAGLAREHHDPEDAGHDLGHLRRVWAHAERIADTEDSGSVDRLVLLAACWLHDLVNLPKDHPDRRQAARRSAQRAAELLAAAGFPPDRIPLVAGAISQHSYSAAQDPSSPEAAILQDADRLEALGAIGIARCFYTAGRLGSRLWHDADPAGTDRTLDDQAHALDHFVLKLRQLPERMHTRGGRRLARERAAFLFDFRTRLLDELDP